MPSRITKTLIAHLKREAKRRAKLERRTHAELLDELAGQHGFASWSLLSAALPKDSPAVIRRQLAASDRLYDAHLDFSVPIDPDLPAGFDSTPNELRTPEQLRKWWDRPYALSMPDGQLTVRCLDGGAWDRSTWYGVAGSHEQARALAREKLAKWHRMTRAEAHYSDGKGLWLVRTPRRPGDTVVFIEPAEIVVVDPQKP